MKSLHIIASLLLTSTLLSSANAAAQCAPLNESRAQWMIGTVALWKTVSRESLKLAGSGLPLIVFFDEHCAWYAGDVESMPEGISAFAETTLGLTDELIPVRAAAHEGMVALPDGSSIPAKLILFSTTFGEAKTPFHVMPLPSIWRKAPQHANEPVDQLDVLVRSVFVHEMTHTKQSGAFAERLDAIEREQALGDALDDNIIQTRFASDEEFNALIERERKLLYDAVAAADPALARQFAATALQTMGARRARYYGGELDWLATLEDTFLYMEGAANWAAYEASRAQGRSSEEALKDIRRGGRYWSQDIGLGLFLVIDRLLPDWQTVAFSKYPGTVTELLTRAVHENN